MTGRARQANPAACYGHFFTGWAADSSGQLLAVDVFYGLLWAAGGWGVLLRWSPAFRTKVTAAVGATRVFAKEPGLGEAWTVGAGVLHATGVAIMLWWAQWWWAHVHVPEDAAHPIATQLAKTLGHLNDLLVGWLLLLASKKSVWQPVLALSFEQGVGTHRMLGYCMIVAVLLHFW